VQCVPSPASSPARPCQSLTRSLRHLRAALATSAVPLDAVSLHLHVYQPPSSSRVTEFSTSPHNDDDGDADVPAASVLELPSLSLEGVWDTLIYDGDVKGKLLNYIYSTMLFSDALVDFNIVTWNRCVALLSVSLATTARTDSTLAQRRPPARTAGDGQDLPVPLARSEARHPPLRPVRPPPSRPYVPNKSLKLTRSSACAQVRLGQAH